MNKKQAAEVMAKKLNIKKYEAYNFIDLLIEVMTENLSNGNKIVLSKFGTFKIINKKKKKVLNPNTKHPMYIQPTRIVKFIPSENFKNTIH